MTQQPLFCEDIYEALRTIGQAYGGSKKIGGFLWPDKPIDKAAQLWTDCLNRTRPEKLDPEQVLAVLKIGRQIGCHAGIHFIDNQCGYRSDPVEPEDEKAALMRQFNESVKLQAQIVTRLEAINK
jgi:hypothetical protein